MTRARGSPRFTTRRISAEKLEIQPKKGGATAEMILPKVEFRDASLQECVEFLVQKGKGLNVVFRNRGGIAQEMITLSLTEIPIAEVRRYVAAFTGYGIVADEHTITLRPAAK